MTRSAARAMKVPACMLSSNSLLIRLLIPSHMRNAGSYHVVDNKQSPSWIVFPVTYLDVLHGCVYVCVCACVEFTWHNIFCKHIILGRICFEEESEFELYYIMLEF